MKITDISTVGYLHKLKEPLRFCHTTRWHRGLCVVRIHTDEGIVGITGRELHRPGHYARVQREIVELKPLLIGADPYDTERIYHALGGDHRNGWVGVALWDIKGKASGLPIYKLLGGAANPALRQEGDRLHVRMYASALFRQDLDGYRREAKSYAESGFTAMKMRVGPDVDKAIASVRTVREGVGPRFDLMVDVNCGYDVPTAIRLGREMEAFDVFHFEEPVAKWDYAGNAQVAAAIRVPVAGGEGTSIQSMKQLILHRGACIVQPDAKEGYTYAKRVAALAEAFGIIVTPHCFGSAIATAANLHFVAATAGCKYSQEYNTTVNPFRTELLKQPLIPVDGYLEVPHGPGLGIEIDDDAVERYRIEE